jgi:hypothetical protein
VQQESVVLIIELVKLLHTVIAGVKCSERCAAGGEKVRQERQLLQVFRNYR